MPFLALTVGFLIAVTAACASVLALGDLARNAARLAAVSADPSGTAGAFVAEHAPDVTVAVSGDNDTVHVRLTRTLRIRLPLLRVPLPGITVSADSVMAVEPPWPVAPSG